MTIKQLYVDAIEALNLNIFISVCLRSESHIAHHELPSIDGNQRTSNGDIHPLQNGKGRSSRMNMMQDDQSRSSKYAGATAPVMSLLMALAVCLSLNCRERERKSTSEDRVTW